MTFTPILVPIFCVFANAPHHLLDEYKEPLLLTKLAKLALRLR